MAVLKEFLFKRFYVFTEQLYGLKSCFCYKCFCHKLPPQRLLINVTKECIDITAKILINVHLMFLAPLHALGGDFYKTCSRECLCFSCNFTRLLTCIQKGDRLRRKMNMRSKTVTFKLKNKNNVGLLVSVQNGIV